MKNIVLLPTEDNLVEALYNDTIDRNKDLVYFYKILQALEKGMSIAIDGKWGSGKTFFAKQMQLIINSLNTNCDMDEEIKAKALIRLPLSDKNADEINFDVSVYYDASNI